MPLLKALRALLVLATLLVVVPTQTGGALAVDDLGFLSSAVTSQVTTSERTRDPGSSKLSHRSHFVAPDDGTAVGAALFDVLRRTSATKTPVFHQLPLASTLATRQERPPKA